MQLLCISYKPGYQRLSHLYCIDENFLFERDSEMSKKATVRIKSRNYKYHVLDDN